MLDVVSKLLLLLTLGTFEDQKVAGARSKGGGFTLKNDDDLMKIDQHPLIILVGSDALKLFDFVYNSGHRQHRQMGGFPKGDIRPPNFQHDLDLGLDPPKDIRIPVLGNPKFQRAALLLIPSIKSFLVRELLVTLEENSLLYQIVTYSTWFTNALAILDYLADFRENSQMAPIVDWMTTLVWLEFFTEVTLIVIALVFYGVYTVYDGFRQKFYSPHNNDVYHNAKNFGK